MSISSQCASALDNLAGFYFKHFVAAEDGPSPAGQVLLLEVNDLASRLCCLARLYSSWLAGYVSLPGKAGQELGVLTKITGCSLGSHALLRARDHWQMAQYQAEDLRVQRRLVIAPCLQPDPVYQGGRQAAHVLTCCSCRPWQCTCGIGNMQHTPPDHRPKICHHTH